MCIPCAWRAHAASTRRARGTRSACARRARRVQEGRAPRARCEARTACRRGRPDRLRVRHQCVTPLHPEPEPNREQEFIRIGYYVNTEYDAPELMEAPPEQIQVRVRVRVRVSSP